MRTFLFVLVFFNSLSYLLGQQMNIDSLRIENNTKTGDSLFDIGDYYEASGYYFAAKKSTDFIALISDTTTSNYQYYSLKKIELEQKIFLSDSLFSTINRNDYFIKKHKKNALQFIAEGKVTLAVEEYKKVLKLAPNDTLSKSFVMSHLSQKKDTIYLGIDSKEPAVMDSTFKSLSFFTDPYSQLFWAMDTSFFSGVLVIQELDIATLRIKKTIAIYNDGYVTKKDCYLTNQEIKLDDLPKIKLGNVSIYSDDSPKLIFHCDYWRSQNQFKERTKFVDSINTYEVIFNFDLNNVLSSTDYLTFSPQNDTIFYFSDGVEKDILYFYEKEEYLGKEISIIHDNVFEVRSYDHKNRLIRTSIECYNHPDTLYEYLYEEDYSFKLTTIYINNNTITFISNDWLYYDKKKFVTKERFTTIINYYKLQYSIFLFPVDPKNGIYVPVVVSSRTHLDFIDSQIEARFRGKLMKQIK